ncbi:SPP1 [Sanghuangporus weigelae]
MAARRRLDISSLLCDSKEDSPVSRTDALLSRPREEHKPQPQQVLTQVPSPGYPSSEQGAFVYSEATSPYNSPQYERTSQYQRGPQQRRQDGPVYYWEKRSPESLPSAADLVPLALQATSPSRRTPSPSFLVPTQSAADRTGLLRPSRHSEGLQEATFPRSSTSSTQPLQHPHRYSQFPQPPPSSTSPVNIHQSSEPAREQRASHRFNVHQYSPISQTHPSPSPSSASSLPNKFSASARPLSISPTDLARPQRPSTSGSVDKTLHLSSVLPRQSETNMNTSQRTSASLSPTVPISGLSGLDVLVQAATEERERIDVHRRLSGGEEPQLSSNYVSSARHASLSPVVPRGEIFQAPPPIPPYRATSQTPIYVPPERVESYYNVQSIEDVERRLPSPEPFHTRQMDDARAPENRLGVALPVINKLERRSQSLEAGYAGYERASLRLSDAPRLPSATSRHLPGSRPASLYGASSSARTTAQQTYLEDEEASTSNQFPHTLSLGEPGPIPYVRRSPPRSKPKPKKPGSAALASLEKELAESHNKGSGSKQIRRLSPPRSQMQRKLPDIGSMARQSNERGASEDEDVDDFFLSAFDSPRNAARQIPSRKPVPVDIPSAHSREDGVSLESWHHTQPRRSSGEQQVYSPAIFRASPERTDEYSNYSSPLRGVLDLDDEETMPDVEAEILDEIAEAAGGTTSDAERTDFDDQATDNMEVDVENELLSLIDGPPEPPSKSYHQAKPPLIHSPRHSGLQDLDLDRMSMPPPDISKAISAKLKDSKKRPTKPKLKQPKGPPDEVTKPAKGFSAQPEDASAKLSKPKTGAKPRPAKGLPVEKAKGPKVSKEPSTPLSASLPTLSEPVASSSTPTDEAFPIVTSSGRMVTKSKKSAAASTILHNQSSLSHRRKVVPPIGWDGGHSRSRSHSVMPRASVDPEPRREKTAKEDEEKAKEKDAPALEPPDDPDKDKLYCICRTQYDEDRVMIACDRCDEWYHTQCVNMPDLLVDLVDQFICSKCIAQNPSLNLQTTYKQRCFSGLKHPDPDSPEACHKPSRGAYSKYCSDECGVRHMDRKIQSWAGNGGDVRSLWESVKDAKRREGFVMREPDRTLPKAILAEIQNNGLPRPQASVSEVKQTLGDEEGRNSIVFRLEEQLQTIVQEREELKKQLEVLSWRERLLQLASDRADSVGDCGWDQRLVYGDEEWMEFGAGVLESYDEAAPNGHSEEGQDMDVDGGTVVGEWWCRGKKKCERHVGWQRVRAADMELERTTKEDALADLTVREREIRSRIEDILHPQSRPVRVYAEETLKFKLSSPEGGGKKAKKKPAAA